MMTLFVWYPKCSTCQKAKKKLEELGVTFELRDIVLDTPTARELKEWIEKGISSSRNCIMYPEIYINQWI